MIIGRGDLLHVITRRKLVEAAEKHRDLGAPFDVRYRLTKRELNGLCMNSL
jgi:hypothetical protein